MITSGLLLQQVFGGITSPVPLKFQSPSEAVSGVMQRGMKEHQEVNWCGQGCCSQYCSKGKLFLPNAVWLEMYKASGPEPRSGNCWLSLGSWKAAAALSGVHMVLCSKGVLTECENPLCATLKLSAVAFPWSCSWAPFMTHKISLFLQGDLWDWELLPQDQWRGVV